MNINAYFVRYNYYSKCNLDLIEFIIPTMTYFDLNYLMLSLLIFELFKT